MKTWILFLVCASVANCVGADLESIRNVVKVGKDAKGAFISTNSASARFYLISTNLNLPSMVGAKRNADVISRSRMELDVQYSPSMQMLNGRPFPWGYIFISGRYAVLSGRVLSLTDFSMHVSDDEGTRGEVLSVNVKSLTFQVDATLATEAERLIRKRPEPE